VYKRQDYKSPLNWLIDSWYGHGMAQPGAWLIPRQLIEKAGEWNESLSLNDDGEFFCRILLQANSINYVPNSKVYYRSNIASSLSQTRSHKAIRSELTSYKLYVGHSLLITDSCELRRALANNFLNFIYHYHSSFPEICKEAEKEFQQLNVGKMWPVGGKRFKQLASIIGFKNALKLKALI
jgi:hypothetical protein